MDTKPKEMTAKEAIDGAFSYFREFFDSPYRGNVLLEGIEYLDQEHQWLVTIGFDAGRSKETQSPFGFGDKTKEPIRELRAFVISANDGSLVRMT